MGFEFRDARVQAFSTERGLVALPAGAVPLLVRFIASIRASAVELFFEAARSADDGEAAFCGSQRRRGICQPLRGLALPPPCLR